MNIILRKALHSLDSCKGIQNHSVNDIRIVSNNRPLPRTTSLVFKWGCSTPTDGVGVVNESRAISLVSDKRRFRQHLRTTSPNTIPTTWFGDEEVTEFPVIVRPRVHAGGREIGRAHV